MGGVLRGAIRNPQSAIRNPQSEMPRSFVSIDELTNDEIEAVFQLADRFLDEMATSGKPFRIQGRCELAQEHILATIFHEPSTRTRLSFETAMLRMGGNIISCADARSSSSSKGETIADAVRVLENYADVIVIRHPFEGAARVASEYTDVPVINAGDGSHEHPTQTLCDLYTLRVARGDQQGKRGAEVLKDLNVVLRGDLQHGRTVHSLAYALARFGARILPDPAPGCGFPDHVRRRLARDYNCYPLNKKEIDELSDAAFPADVLYLTPEEPHQLALMPDVVDVWLRLSKKQQKAVRGIKSVDAFYATRLQLERLEPGEDVADYPAIDSEFLKQRRYRNSRVLHPLPRVDELSYDIDRDKRSIYFEQAAYGVPVRMALVAALLELEPSVLQNASPASPYAQYSHANGVRCSNKRCVTRQESEQRYLVSKYWIVDERDLTLRCAYCDYEQEVLVVSRASTHKYTTDVAHWRDIDSKDLVLFADEHDAVEAGYQAKKRQTRSAKSAK